MIARQNYSPLVLYGVEQITRLAFLSQCTISSLHTITKMIILTFDSLFPSVKQL